MLYASHRTLPISDVALSNDFERKCHRIAVSLRCVVGLCFLTILLLAGLQLLPWSLRPYSAVAMNWLVGFLFFIGILCVVVDAWPLARDVGRFKVYAYQKRQLMAAHDLENAATLARLTLPELVLTEKWLGPRFERSRLRPGILLGGSDMVAILAVATGAWTVWHNLPSGASLTEQLLASASIATMAYQPELLALAIRQHKPQPRVRRRGMWGSRCGEPRPGASWMP